MLFQEEGGEMKNKTISNVTLGKKILILCQKTQVRRAVSENSFFGAWNGKKKLFLMLQVLKS